MNLRPYQLAGIEAIRRAIVDDGHRRICVVAATGTGKTVCFASLIQTGRVLGTRYLVMAHRRELISQAVSKLLDAGLPLSDIGVVMGDGWIYLRGQRVNLRNPSAGVQVASVDTLRNRTSPPPADIVIVDECHRSLSPTYLRVIDEHYPNAIVIGWTATPIRGDGRPLSEAYDKLIIMARPSQAIAWGAIVKPRVLGIPEDRAADLSGVAMRGADYDPVQLAAAMDKGELVGDIVEHWLREADNRITVVFAASVGHSKHLAERFVAAGVRAEHLDGTTDDAERAAILARLDRGDTRVVTNFGVLAEGWDQPSCKCLVLARPTKSTGLYLQQAGRILRPWNGVQPLILDHAGCCLEHGLPDFDHEYSLDPPKKRKKGTALPCKTCPKCYAVVPSSCKVCDAPMPSGELCGFIFVVVDDGSLLDEEDGTLEEQDGKRWARMLVTWRALLEQAELEEWGLGRERNEFREVYKRFPPKAFPKRKIKLSQADLMNEWKRLLDLEKRKGYRYGWARGLFQERFGMPPPELPTVNSAPTTNSATIAVQRYVTIGTKEAASKGQLNLVARLSGSCTKEVNDESMF